MLKFKVKPFRRKLCYGKRWLFGKEWLWLANGKKVDPLMIEQVDIMSGWDDVRKTDKGMIGAALIGGIIGLLGGVGGVIIGVIVGAMLGSNKKVSTRQAGATLYVAGHGRYFIEGSEKDVAELINISNRRIK